MKPKYRRNLDAIGRGIRRQRSQAEEKRSVARKAAMGRLVNLAMPAVAIANPVPAIPQKGARPDA